MTRLEFIERAKHEIVEFITKIPPLDADNDATIQALPAPATVCQHSWWFRKDEYGIDFEVCQTCGELKP